MLTSARAILPRRHESIGRPSWHHPKIEDIRRDTPILFLEENREIRRLKDTKANDGRVLDRSEERLLFEIRKRLNARAEQLGHQLKNGRPKDQRRLIEKELFFINRTNETLVSMITVTNQKMVRHIAAKFMAARSARHMSIEDLIQEGNIGLITAIKKFDVDKGNSFYTYADRWIRHSIRVAIGKKDRAVYVPFIVTRAQLGISRFISAYRAAWNKEPAVSQIAEATKFRADVVKRALAAMADKVLLELDENRDHHEARTPLDIVLAKELEMLVAQWVADLRKEKDQQLIKRRFGLGGEEETTLEAIGDGLHLTRERVRQMQKRILSRLSRAARRAGWDSC